MNYNLTVKYKRCSSVCVSAFNAIRCTLYALRSTRFPRSTLHASRASGIALVMVLGILSVMVIMAVAFAISMRTERVAAGNYADSVRARQLVQAGLARALDDLAGKLGTNGLKSYAGGTNYPPWDATNSYTTTYTNTSTNANLLQLLETDRANEATNFVPRALWVAATQADYTATAADTNAAHHWLLIESVGANPPTTNIMGRVKYLILNCSGLLDANFAGGAAGTVVAITRVGSSNPADIAIGNLGEVKSDFLTTRQTDVRYETMGELNTLAGINKPATNLFVYSRSLPGYWNTNPPAGVGTQVNLSGSMANLTNRVSEITNAFAHADFSQFESGVLYSNLIDYVDPGPIPSNFEYCVKNVPMINEVVVSNGIEVSAGSDANHRSYKVFTDVYVECWYPFVKSSAFSFSLNVANTFSGTPGFEHSAYIASNSLTSASGSPPIKYLCYQYVGTPFDLLTASSITLTTTIDPKVQWGGNNVDVLKTPISLTTTHVGDGSIARDNKAASLECRDPRFNYDPADLNRWRPRAIFPLNAPIADVNPWVTECWSSNTVTGDGDTDSAMYVAGEQLRSVAELGCLVYNPNTPWKTVKLYGPTLHRVLDVFGLSTNTSDVLMTNMVYSGRVNCNPNVATDATAVVFAGMPVDQYPGGPSNPVSMANAQIFASEIFAGGIYTNLSDIGRNLANFPGATTELERESYLRNAVNFLNVRQNLFTIIIEAHVASGGNIPRNPVRQRAVALVWRDPYTGEMFVRSIKWLRD